MPTIAVIPGDGAGIEVTEVALTFLRALDTARRLDLRFEVFPFGAEEYLRTGVAMPPGQIDRFRADYDAILFGAVGDPRVKDNVHAREILLALRFGLDLYVNFRPCRLLADRLSPLKGKGTREIDFVVFRENTEGPYRGEGELTGAGTVDERAVSYDVNTRRGVERIIRAAFEWAKANGKRRVAMADKSNAIPAHGLWLRTFREVAADYERLEARHYYVDNLALQLVRRPEDFEVIVTTNLFGDILTDVGAALTGGLGVAASANLNPDSTPLFEPVHGSAPDLAGKDAVNPIAMFLCCAMMLRALGHPQEALAIEAAARACVESGEVTRDLGGVLGTKAAAQALSARALAALRQ